MLQKYLNKAKKNSHRDNESLLMIGPGSLDSTKGIQKTMKVLDVHCIDGWKYKKLSDR